MEGILNSPYFQKIVAKIGYDKAIKYLGLDKQTQNPKYAISLGGININPKNMLMRAGLNKVMSGGLGGMFGPAALMGGAFMLSKAFDPLNPNSRNYNPALQGQVDYLNFNNMIGSNQNSGLTQYGPGSVLSGQNVASMFGTNDYEKQLNKYKDKYYDTMSQKRKDKLDKEIADIQDHNVQKTIEKNQFKNLQNINAGGDGGGSSQTGGWNDQGGPVSNKTGRGRQGWAKGGLASLWQR